MGVEYAAERRLLAEDEIAPVQRSHFPELEALPQAELVDLARWLRERRARARDIIHDRRRQRRGKGALRGAGGEASERGLAAKKQVFARALKRVNARLDHLSAEAKREANLAQLRAALARVQGQAPSHPGAGTTAGAGMAPRASRRARSGINPGRIGSTSQAGKAAQARRDGRG